MKVFISGLGSIGLRHARNFASLGADQLIIFDPSGNRNIDVCEQVDCQFVDNFGDAFDLDPDLSVISSPNCFHIEQAIAAAEQGSHLFIEKPLSHTLEGVNELIDLVESKNLFAHVGSNWKFHPAFIKMKEMIGRQMLGSITGAQVIAGQWLPDWHPWEDYKNMYSAKKSLAGGVVLDSHEFDYLTWLLGPVSLMHGYMARSGVLEIETEDVAVACMQFSSGVLATVHVDYIQRSYRRRYHISGDRGTIEWDYTKGNIIYYDANSGENELIDVQLDDLNEMYKKQCEHVINGVKENEEPVTSVRDAGNVLDILLKIKE